MLLQLACPWKFGSCTHMNNVMTHGFCTVYNANISNGAIQNQLEAAYPSLRKLRTLQMATCELAVAALHSIPTGKVKLVLGGAGAWRA